jgi:hypothetical protein
MIATAQVPIWTERGPMLLAIPDIRLTRAQWFQDRIDLLQVRGTTKSVMQYWPDRLNLPQTEAPIYNCHRKCFMIALFFSGKHHCFAELVATCLAYEVGRDCGLYDRHDEADFARQNFDTYLPNLYDTQSKTSA